MSRTSGLTVRQHKRSNIALDIEFVIADEHGEQVRFSGSSHSVDAQTVRGTALDISPGGMGLSFRHFVPRMCEGAVRVFGPDPVGTASDGSPIHDVIFEHDVKVRRVYLTSHTPTYAVGVSFIDPEPGLETRVGALLERFGSAATTEAQAGVPDG